MEYNLRDLCVFGASNSGKTKELIRLFHGLKTEGGNQLFGLTAFADSPLEQYCKAVHVLTCGSEDAVAATKSVVEQALFYQAVFEAANGRTLEGYKAASEKIAQALSLSIPEEIAGKIAAADTVYFAGRNNGVAEELTLKTNEITRKKSDFLEGTYAVHGIEEVMKSHDVVIVIDPYVDEEEKFLECLHKGVGASLIAISKEKQVFLITLLSRKMMILVRISLWLPVGIFS